MKLSCLFQTLSNIRYYKRAQARGNHIFIDKDDISRIKIKISGGGNTIRIGKLASSPGIISINVRAQNSVIEIGEGFLLSRKLVINMTAVHAESGLLQNSSIKIGRRVSVEEAEINVLNSNAHIIIGERCMFSRNIMLYHTDAHPIYAFGTDRIVNKVKTMNIGDHVWIGANVTVLKNVNIPSGCIVGWGSVVSGQFKEEHSIIVGNPARQISNKKIDWRSSDIRYVENARND